MALPPQKPGSPPRPGQRFRQESEAERTKRTESERHASEDLADQCQQIEEELEELKARYEMYFLGIERMEPSRRREEMKRSVARLRTAFTRNTGLRFRIQTLHARYLAYERMWLRAGREKEEGTYKRDLFKARRRGRPQRANVEEKKFAAEAEDVDLSDWGSPQEGEKIALTPVPMAPTLTPVPGAAAPAARAKKPPSEPRPPAQEPSGAPVAGMLADHQMRSLYDAYITAKKRCNEDVSKLSYEAVTRSVAKQVPEIMSRYKAKAVDFKVIIKDGRAILKAVPKT